MVVVLAISQFEHGVGRIEVVREGRGEIITI